uniref:2-methoxy-6-polyprenyl-1,4-benzoquinol methylase, mitochondrial n=1 Tax=Eptatretus burgeri TaxID=7764 RepID=A0A8C4QWF2_EPTBU
MNEVCSHIDNLVVSTNIMCFLRKARGVAAALARRCLSVEARKSNFGYEVVTETEKTNKVYGVFQNVAKNYDTMNDAMSLGIHRWWKDSFMRLMNATPGIRLLDVAGGTGDIAFRFLDYISSKPHRAFQKEEQDLSWEEISQMYEQREGEQSIDKGSMVVVCDINKEMLHIGQARARERTNTNGLSWILGNAEELPVADNKFDIYSIAFGIRNVTDIPRALDEAYRVLRPGGRFMCLEFSHVTNPVVERLYDIYSFQIIPVLGEVIAEDWKSYQYLVESIRLFPDQVQPSRKKRWIET